MAEYLDQIVRAHDTEQTAPHPRFAAKKLPPISTTDYLKRIQKYTDCSNVCFLIALIYLDRIQQTCSDILLNSYTVLRLILASTVAAIKYSQDDTLRNADYAKIGGVQPSEMNALEFAFAEILDFNFFITELTFEAYREQFSRGGN